MFHGVKCAKAALQAKWARSAKQQGWRPGSHFGRGLVNIGLQEVADAGGMQRM